MNPPTPNQRGQSPGGERLAELAEHLPADTITAWTVLAPLVPGSGYLAGGTALAVHLRHRVSRDLDFFIPHEFDVEALLEALHKAGEFTPTYADSDTLNGIFGATKVQFLEAAGQHEVAPATDWEGVRVASIPDLLAMKLKVIVDRGELRDYFDIMTIDTQTPFSVETGLGFYLERFRPVGSQVAVEHIIRALGYLGDVPDDPGLPVERDVIARFWAQRVPALRRGLA